MSPGVRVSVAIMVAVIGAVCFWQFAPPSAPTSLPPSSVSGPPPSADTVAPIADAPPVIAVPTPPPESTVAANGPGVFWGVTKNTRDEIVAGATIDVYPHEWMQEPPARDRGSLRTANSGADGAWRIEGLAVGHFTLTARATDGAGARSIDFEVAQLSAENPSVEIKFMVDRCGHIAGRVVDAAQRPIANAILTPYQSSTQHVPTTGVTAFVLRTLTDAEGRFEIADLRGPKWKLRAEAKGFGGIVTEFFDVGSHDNTIVLQNGRRIEGVAVLGASGEAVQQLQVELGAKGIWNLRSTKTSDAGAFAFEDLSPGVYVVQPKHAQLVLADGKNEIDVPPTGVTASLRLELLVGGVVEGRVTDATSGAPIAGVSIKAEHHESGAPIVAARSATSDANGAYRLEGLARLPYALRREQIKGYPQENWNDMVRVSPEPGGAPLVVDFALERGLGIAGKVVDPEGEGVEGAELNSSGMTCNAWQQCRSEANGNFELLGFPPDCQVSVGVQKPGFALRPQTFSIGAEGVRNVVLQLEAEAVLSGVVVDENGDPLASYTVVAHPEVQTNVFWPQVTTDGDGKFRLGGLFAAKYRLRASPPKSQTWMTNGSGLEISVRTGESVDGIRLVYEASGTLEISGRIADERDAPVRGAHVSGYLSSGEGGSQTQSDEEGEYVISGLAAGAYNVSVNHQSYTGDNRMNIQAGATDVDFVLKGRGGIEGRVVLALSGEPVEDFEVQCANGRHNILPPWLDGQFTRVRSPDGRFSLKELEVGECTLFARAAGYGETQLFVTVKSGETATGVELRLEPGSSLEVFVFDTHRQPVSGAYVSTGELYDGNLDQSPRVVRTDETGRAFLDSVSTTATTVTVAHPGYARATADISAHPARVELTLTVGTVLSGTVSIRGASNIVEPLAGARISVMAGESNKSATSEADGAYRVGGLGAGIAQVRVHHPQNRRRLERLVTLTADGEDVASFVFAGGVARLEGQVIGKIDAARYTQLTLEIKSDSGNVELIDGSLDAQQRFSFDGVPAGDGTLHFMAHAGEAEMAGKKIPVTLVAGQTTRQDLVLASGLLVTGALLGNEKSLMTVVALIPGEVEVKEFSPELMMRIEREVTTVTRVVSGGAFQLKNVEPGKYTLLAIAFDAEPRGPEDLKLARFTTQIVDVLASGVAPLEVTLPLKPPGQQ
ncbi:MAG: carboxypeptidase regulatory-like domain-containing protein [Planctomycetota bacterium]